MTFSYPFGFGVQSQDLIIMQALYHWALALNWSFKAEMESLAGCPNPFSNNLWNLVLCWSMCNITEYLKVSIGKTVNGIHRNYSLKGNLIFCYPPKYVFIYKNLWTAAHKIKILMLSMDKFHFFTVRRHWIIDS